MDTRELAESTSMPKTPLGMRFFSRVLSEIKHGEIALEMPSRDYRQQFTGSTSGSSAVWQIHRPWHLAARLLARGDLGLAESYMAGEWQSPDLTKLLQVMASNEEPFGVSATGFFASRLSALLKHRMSHNSERGSRRNISYHYDLGNDFYAQWLDPGMAYSSAVFSHESETLQRAQTRKYELLLQRLNAKPGEHILEIGCGWGGFAMLAASKGMRVTGITLSQRQLEFAQQGVAQAGLSQLVELKLLDYRKLDQQFDHIVSIEMFEAVGEQYWDSYFQTVARSLKPGGRAALQMITINPDYFDSYRRGTDFIQRYIFPGGMLPSPPVFVERAAQAKLKTVEPLFLGSDYAATLRCWMREFRNQESKIVGLGYDQRFMRMWHYYLRYCEAGFNTNRVDLMQITLKHAGNSK